MPESHWSYPYVSSASERGWIRGYGDGTFGVDNDLTYAEFTTMLVRAFYAEELDRYSGPTDAWYTAPCNVADGKGLFSGTAVLGKLTDDILVTPINRYEMAEIIYNCLAAAGKAQTGDGASVADHAVVPDKYKAAVAGVAEAGIISGVDTAGTFSGETLMTRGQAAAIMYRLDGVMSAGGEAPVKTSGNYLGSVESDKYHTPGCRFADAILDTNRIWFDTKEEAAAAGYSPCGMCKP